MLKLEKVSKTLDIHITLRKREKLFNRSLLQALSIAIALHLAGILFFPIAVAKMSGAFARLPPVSVAAELPITAENSVAVEVEEVSPRIIRTPPSLSLKAPPLPIPELPSLEPLQKQISLPSFASIEEAQRDPLLPLLDPVPHYTQPVTIATSGPISASQLTQEIILPAPIPKGRYRTVFQVEMEERTGRIFWFERKEADPHEPANLYAEKILQNLKFQTLQNAFVSSGEVEIVISQ